MIALSFLAELEEEASHIDALTPWVLLGDFNLICDPSEKSNDNFDHLAASDFNDAIRRVALQEIPLLDRLFTWSNRQHPPILAKLDRFLINNAFGSSLPNSSATSWDSSAFDHVPILLTATTMIPRPTTFCFNNHWICYASYHPTVQQASTSIAAARPNLPISKRLTLCLK